MDGELPCHAGEGAQGAAQERKGLEKKRTETTTIADQTTVRDSKLGWDGTAKETKERTTTTPDFVRISKLGWGIRMKDFTHHNARTVDEAVALLGKQKGKAKLNAGGTDLLGLLKDMVTPDYPESIINIKGVPGLDYVREDEEGLRIGALTKLSTIVGSSTVTEKYGILAEAAKSVATPQIRNMCTIGGNLAQDVRCWYYRYHDQLGGTVMCLRKGVAVCNALIGDNRYHSIFGTAALPSYPCASHCPAGIAIPSYLGKIK